MSYAHKEMKRLMGKAIYNSQLIGDGDRILVAVSGGQDSLSLLWLLRERLKRIPIDYSLTAVHVELGFGQNTGNSVEQFFNEHGFDWLKYDPVISRRFGGTPQATAEEAVNLYTDKMVPFQGDMLMLDYSDGNMYSEHMVKLVTWHRYYTRFWKQSALFCDWRWPDFLNLYAPP